MSAVPDPAEQPTMTVEEAGDALGISRASAYEAVRSGAIPALRVGRRWIVPTAPVRRMLKLDAG
jgi:excisionase family DNA binding protein